jgi:hypothetical protein
MKRPILFGLLLDEDGNILTTAATTTAGDPNFNISNDFGGGVGTGA